MVIRSRRPSRQVNALRQEEGSQPIPGVSQPDELATELLKHNIQRRQQKWILFWAGLLVCGFIFFIFCFALLGCVRTLELLEKTPFILVPLSILGATPVIMLIILFRCVFRPPQDNDLIDKKDMETIREIISLFKSVN